jgi:heme/copper-type cytochrome/quinol oxidase subunit 2
MVAAGVSRMSLGIVSAALLLCARGDCGVLIADDARPALRWTLSQGQESAPARREITIQARRCTFSPDRIEVNQDDLLKLTLVAEDIPHSFTIDAYRIAKRATPGRPVIFEFRADRPGSFTYYRNLSEDAACDQMQGELVVKPRQNARGQSSPGRD